MKCIETITEYNRKSLKYLVAESYHQVLSVRLLFVEFEGSAMQNQISNAMFSMKGNGFGPTKETKQKHRFASFLTNDKSLTLV